MDQGNAQTGRRQKVAVIGTGISGLSAAWMLHDTADITVYEQNAHVGGHTRTIDVETRDGVALRGARDQDRDEPRGVDERKRHRDAVGKP